MGSKRICMRMQQSTRTVVRVTMIVMTLTKVHFGLCTWKPKKRYVQVDFILSK